MNDVLRRAILLASIFSLHLLPSPVSWTWADDADDDEKKTAPETYVETVTVTATRSERAIAETPGHVDVISSEEIETLGYTGIDDLTRYTPGVYVENDVTRLGTSGFNIRGIGGNRVLTQIDGVPIAEQFDFGPFSVTQFQIDVDNIESVEVVRSAGSALYGSDALGGVVSLVTKSPRSYLGDAKQFFGFRGGFDGRSDEISESLVYARGTDRWQGSLVYTHRDSDEADNQGEIASQDFTRTLPNPIERSDDNALVKLSRTGESGSALVAAAEWFDGDAETEILSSRRPGSPFGSGVADADARDTRQRLRLSLEQSLVQQTALTDSLLWRVYWQDTDTDQVFDEIRTPSVGLADREGFVGFEQTTLGLDLEVRKALDTQGDRTFTYGLQYRQDAFSQFRDRTEFVIETGEPVPTSLVFPTRYFPESDTSELGVFFQAELALLDGKLRLVPGVRYDRYDLESDENDAIFLAGNPGQNVVADLSTDSVSPKLGIVFQASDVVSLFAQYARGFRAPPMSAFNNGFTNPAGGYRTLPNADLDPETSDNFELGLRGNWRRGSFSVTYFDNQYDDFIETVFLGFNPAVFLVEFQPQNITNVSISGVEFAGDLRFGRSWRLRGALSLSEGDNDTAGEPLDSIAPGRLVAGLRYQRPNTRWGLEGTATFVESKGASDLPSTSTQFQAPSYEVIDLAAWWSVNDWLTLQLSAWNLTDETYWTWTNARGQGQNDSDLDRYTSPGRSAGLQARFNF